MDQIIKIDRFIEEEVSKTGLFESAKELKATLKSKCNTAFYFVDEQLQVIEQKSFNLNAMLEDALLIMKLEKQNKVKEQEPFDLNSLKNELIVRFQNFYPFIKFNLSIEDVELVNLNVSFFKKAVDKLIDLALNICNGQKPKVRLVGSSIFIDFTDYRITKDAFAMISKGQVNDSEQGEIEAISLRLEAVKRLLELSGTRLDLKLLQDGQLQAHVNCGNTIQMNERGVA